MTVSMKQVEKLHFHKKKVEVQERHHPLKFYSSSGSIIIISLQIPCARFSHLNMFYCLAKRSDKGVNVISSFCDKYHTSEDELRTALTKTNHLIEDLLKKKPSLISDCLQKEALESIDPGT
jgi:retinoblastoma-like protein 1